MKRTQLPVLSPCAADWDTMTPAGRARFCAECQTHVHHVSAMTHADATAFLKEHTGQDLCVRYAYDGAGNVRFADSASTAITTAHVLWPSLRAIAASTLLVAAAHVGSTRDLPKTDENRARPAHELDDEYGSEIMGRIARPQTNTEVSDAERLRRKAALAQELKLQQVPRKK